nr:hypothetical protein [Tanacetum cinerariifolium]
MSGLDKVRYINEPIIDLYVCTSTSSPSGSLSKGFSVSIGVLADFPSTSLDHVQWEKQHFQAEPSVPTPPAVWQTQLSTRPESSSLTPLQAENHEDSLIRIRALTEDQQEESYQPWAPCLYQQHDSENEEEARKSKELDALLNLANAALYEPSLSTTPSKPPNPEQSSELEISPTTLDALLGADVSEDTFFVRMVELMNRRRKAIAEMKAKGKREKPLTPAQQKEFMRTFVKNQSSVIYSTGWTWKDVRGLTNDQLQIVYDKIRRAGDLATAKDHHQHLKRSGKVVATPSSPVSAPTDKELAAQQAAILEADRQELFEQELHPRINAEQVYLDSLLA